MGKIFHEKAMKLAVEQGYGSFQTIKLLAMKARQKQRAVKGIKYLTPEQQAWHKEQDKFTIQAIKELEKGELDLNKFVDELANPIEEDKERIPETKE